MCSNLKSKIKNPIYTVELLQTKKCMGKNTWFWSFYFVKAWNETYHSDLNLVL